MEEDGNALPQEDTPIIYEGREWYTVKQAARKLHTSEKYIRTLAQQYHKFAYHKIHEHMMLCLKSDVDAYQVKRGKPGRPRKEEEAA